MSRGHRRRHRPTAAGWPARAGAALAGALLLAPSPAALAEAAPEQVSATESVIVRETDPGSDLAERLVARLGGRVVAELSIIGGFAAEVPLPALPLLEADPAVAAATVDGTVQLQADTSSWAADPLTYRESGSLWKTAVRFTRADTFWSAGFTGAGIDVAVIDSGVVPVQGLTLPGKVVNAIDLAFESQASDLRHLDGYGHGTHMAGIIAGRDPGVTDPIVDGQTKFVGIAPDARIVNVRVAGSDGAVDVSQVIAAIDWVVQHRTDNGLNIRVLNLSFGTASTQSAALDPLSFAVEQAWKQGIVVVAAAGNDGNNKPLRMPAANPYVIAVGSYDTNNTNVTGDDFLSPFTNCGVPGRRYDVLAPGRSILSLRNPNSRADLEHPGAVVDNRLFRGTGTSQSAAVVSGAVALILDQRPELTPDQVKALITQNAKYLGVIPPSGCPRQSMLQMGKILTAATPTAVQTHPAATGTGSLDASRGADRLEHAGVPLSGERDVHGKPWNGTSWSTAAAQGTSWSGGQWNGTSWSGTSWSGVSWSGVSWSGVSWSGTSWSGVSWSGVSWSGQSWSGTSWSGTSWSGTSWSGTSWSGANWSGQSWE